MKRTNRISLTGLLAIGAITGPAWAAPIIDGRITASDGYQYSTVITPAQNGTGIKAVDNAQLYLYQEANGGALSVAVLLPLSYVDNTYSATDKPNPFVTYTHPTWDNKDGKNNGLDANGQYIKQTDHTYNSLQGSDHATFTLALGGKSQTFSLDYLDAKIDKGNLVIKSATTGGDAKANLAGVTASTSMFFNVNTYLPAYSSVLQYSPALKQDPNNPGQYLYATDDVRFAEWEFAAIYEFKMDASFFSGTSVLDPNGFINGFSLLFDELHASPSKNGDLRTVFNDSPPTGPFTPIPEPASIMIFAAGGWLLISRRIR